jgi:hypothetical protein
MAPDPSKRWFGRLLRPYHWLQSRHLAEDGSAFAFGARLVATMALTVVLVTVTAYVLLERNLARRQIASHATVTASDAKAFESLASHSSSTTDAIVNVDPLLESVAARPGALIRDHSRWAGLRTWATITRALTRVARHASRQSQAAQAPGDGHRTSPLA